MDSDGHDLHKRLEDFSCMTSKNEKEKKKKTKIIRRARTAAPPSGWRGAVRRGVRLRGVGKRIIAQRSLERGGTALHDSSRG